jgi:hypothetical protein
MTSGAETATYRDLRDNGSAPPKKDFPKPWPTPDAYTKSESEPHFDPSLGRRNFLSAASTVLPLADFGVNHRK